MPHTPKRKRDVEDLNVKLHQLMLEHPDLEVISSVHHEVVGDDGGTWFGVLSGVDLADVFVGDNGVVYIKGDDEEDLFQMFYEQRGDEFDVLDRVEVERIIQNEIANVKWEKKIHIFIAL